MAYEIKPYPELSWSKSRDRLFNECLFAYYHHYYQSHNGWDQSASHDQWTSYRLKQLTNLYKLFGEALHTMAQSALTQWKLDRQLPSEDVLNNGIRTILNQGFRQSLNREEWEIRPKANIMLSEIYYEGQLDPAVTKRMNERRPTCVHHFLNSKTLQELRSRTDIEFLEIEELQSYPVKDTKTYVKMDLLYRIRNGEDYTYIIVDWKTGQEDDEDREQLYIYAHYLVNRYKIPVAQIQIRCEYLLSGACRVHEVSQEDLQYIEGFISGSMTRMKDLCEEPRVNKPRDLLAFTPNPSRLCRFCNYRQVCPYEYEG